MTTTGDRLTRDQRREARDIFEGRIQDTSGNPRSGCVHCTGIHDHVRGLPPMRQPCPRIKHARWTDNGVLLEVRYWPNGKWETDDIIFPGDVYGDDDDEGDEDEGVSGT